MSLSRDRPGAEPVYPSVPRPVFPNAPTPCEIIHHHDHVFRESPIVARAGHNSVKRRVVAAHTEDAVCYDNRPCAVVRRRFEMTLEIADVEVFVIRFPAGRASAIALIMQLWLSSSLIIAVLSVTSGGIIPMTVA